MMMVLNDEWGPLFESMLSKLEDPTPLMLGIGEAVKTCTLENFGATGRNRPNEWEMLSPSYQKWLKSHKHAPRDYATLELTGALKGSISDPKVNGFTVSIVAEDEKASYHQLGEGRMKRKFFPINDNTGELTDYCQLKIIEVLDKNFKA
ncbi:MAG: phage virion morphogenesis protein [Patescibacteria group bacterium]|nr:phage virion morphogenesis protein [Patescibacteria group bacterium]